MATGGIHHNLYDLDGTSGGVWIAMPDADIANLGKARQEGVCWLCGDFAEIITTSSRYISGIEPPKGGTPRKKMTNDELQKRIALRAQKQVRRIVNTNEMKYMWTLTFCPTTSLSANKYKEPVDIGKQRDYDEVRKYWKMFCRGLRKYSPGIVWLVVFEKHDSEKTSDEKRGTYHLHFAVSEFLEWEKVTDLWRHGNVRFDDFSRPTKTRGTPVRNPGAYMSKYVSKSFDENVMFRKRYSRSRNSLLPAKIMPKDFFSDFQYEKRPVYQRERTFEFWDEEANIGGIYGVSQTTYKIQH